MSRYDFRMLGSGTGNLTLKPVARGMLLLIEGEKPTDELLLQMNLNAQTELSEKYPEFKKAAEHWKTVKKDGHHLLAGGGGVACAERLHQLEEPAAEWIAQFDGSQYRCYLFEVETAIDPKTGKRAYPGPEGVLAMGFGGIRGMGDIARESGSCQRYRAIFVFAE